MLFTSSSLIVFAAIAGITIIGITALIVNSEGRFNFHWSEKGGSLIIEKRADSPSETTKVDCLPMQENSQTLNCEGK